jgi:undecaprenyl-diphosphatase
MSIWEALILGIVQGATEFLPVSSSGHLVLLRNIFGIEEPALVFDTAVHGGTMIAVLVVLRRDIWNILSRIVQPLTLYLIIATIPAVIAALFFRSQIEDAFATGSLLGFAFLVTSTLLFLSEKLYQRSGTAGKQPHEMTFKDALFIGLFQAVAIMPGVSRSGATISAGLFRGLDRDFAARFSFLLSIPAIAGALLLQTRELIQAGAGESAIGLLPIAVGTISACIVGFFSIRLALKIVRERNLKGFAIYTGILGFFVLIDKFGTNFFF